jgi:hypothetical protein
MRKAVLFAAAIALTPLAHAQTAILDGRAFVADAGIKGKAADEKDDVITFSQGMLHSAACDKYGYAKGDYKASKVGDAVQFEAVTLSDKYGRNVWKGVVRGSEIEGTFVHYPKGWMLNPNPEPIEHWFKGKAKT